MKNKNKNEVKEIQHIVCEVCNKRLTYIAKENSDYEEVEEDTEIIQSRMNDLDDEKIREHTHFHITRNHEEGLHFEEYDESIAIEEDTKERNIKSEVVVCEECFTFILNESKTLGNQYKDKHANVFIY